MKRNGFTLIEVLVVMAMIVLLSIMVITTLNPASQVAKGNDARRKKDLATIKVSFEEYANDHNGCYPNQAEVDKLTNQANCFTDFWNWLKPWPCDPVTKQPYRIAINDATCPSWYKIFAQLENTHDQDIPDQWTVYIHHVGSQTADQNYTSSQVNYGVSSPNISWNDLSLSSQCQVVSTRCFYHPNPENKLYPGCNSTDGCSGGNCYIDNGCTDACAVNCCGSGCNPPAPEGYR